MKVDTQQMDDAYSSLINLQNQLNTVECRIQDVRRTLTQYKFGSEAETIAIITALTLQRKILERREDGVKLLAQALSSASNQYQRCEAEAEARSNSAAVSQTNSGLPYVEDVLDFIPFSIIKPVIETFIKPLIILPAVVIDINSRYLNGLDQQGQTQGESETSKTGSTDQSSMYVPESFATPKKPFIHINENYDISNTQWKEITPRVTNYEGERSAEAYNAVIADLDVENRGRYARTSKDTWCNIYVWDVTKAMGCEIPHYYSKTTGEPLTRAYCLKHPGEYYEMSADRMASYLANYGRDCGWMECDADTAIAMANQGYPTVTAATTTGHVAMVVPQNEGESGVKISQAGASNFEHGAINKGFGKHSVKYYYHL